MLILIELVNIIISVCLLSLTVKNSQRTHVVESNILLCFSPYENVKTIWVIINTLFTEVHLNSIYNSAFSFICLCLLVPMVNSFAYPVILIFSSVSVACYFNHRETIVTIIYALNRGLYFIISASYLILSSPHYSSA